MGTDLESYVELMDSFTGIYRKINLKGSYQEALRRLEDTVLVESFHTESRPSDDEAGTPKPPEPTTTGTPQITPTKEKGSEAGTTGATGATDNANPNQQSGTGASSQAGKGGRHVSPTMMEEWVLKGQSLKAVTLCAKKETSDALKKIFEIFESLLSRPAQEHWEELLVEAEENDETSLAVGNTHKSWDMFWLCQQKFLLQIFKQDTAE